MWNVLHVIPFVFFNEKSNHEVELNWQSMIFIPGIISIIIQKNTWCTSKVHVIYFCSNSVSFLPEKLSYFYFSGTAAPCTLPPPPPSPRHSLCTYASNFCHDFIIFHCRLQKIARSSIYWFLFQLRKIQIPGGFLKRSS